MGNYQGYQKYKDSGVEWLGDIPEHWEVKRLKNVASCNDEALGENTAPDYEIEYVDISSVDLVSGIRHYENMTFEKAPSRARRKVQDGDTIISTVRTYLKSIAAIKKPPINLIVSTGFAVIRPKININSDYIGYLLQSEGFVGKVVSNSVGVSYPAINSSVLISLPVVEPPLNEQQKIAQFLDYKTKQIDELIKKKETLIEKLDEKRTSLISHAVTKGLDSSVPMKDSGIEWLGEIPKHWIISKAKFISHIFVPQRNKPELNSDEGLPWLTMEDMLSDRVYNTSFKVTKEASKKAGSKILKKSSVVASCVGNFGICAVNNIDVIINQQLQAFVPNKNIIPEFLRETVKISKDYFQMIATAATVVYVNQTGFANMPIVLPPKTEQENIINYLEITKQKIDQQKAKIKEAIELLKEYRTSLITNAVTGKIDVCQVNIPSP